MRDYQYKTHQWMQGKAWDACTPVGPYPGTADELDISKQRISTTVNGEKVPGRKHRPADLPDRRG